MFKLKINIIKRIAFLSNLFFVVIFLNLQKSKHVLTYSQQTKATEYKPVLIKHERFTQQMLSLELPTGEFVRVTPEHRFFCNDEWIEAGSLRAGDILHLKGGNYTTVISVEILPHYEKVYNFDIADNENYYVTEDGILVRNGWCGSVDDVKPKLKGEEIELPNATKNNFDYVKRDASETAKLRKEFDSSKRKEFLTKLGKDENLLKEKGFSAGDIAKIKDGKVPTGYQVHHKYPLDDSGTNDFDNLVLIKNDPYHKAITNYQNAVTKGMEGGEVRNIEWYTVPGTIYP